MSAPRILLTRPETESRALAGSLAAEGWAPVVWPLLRIVGVEAVPDTAGAQAVLLTSANAARACPASRLDPLPPRTLCVGEATARAAADAGYRGIAAAGGDAESMIGLIAARLSPSDGPLVFLRGEAVASDLGSVLAGAGFAVRSSIVYRAEPATELPRAIACRLRAGEIAAVALFSPRSAATFARLVAPLGAALAPLAAVAISARAAEPLAALGLGAVAIAAVPDGEAMRAAIAALPCAPRGRGDVRLGPSRPAGLG